MASAVPKPKRHRVMNQEHSEQRVVPLQFTKKGLLVGSVQSFAGGQLLGWVFDPARPNQPVRICAYDGQDLVGEGIADIFRQEHL